MKSITMRVMLTAALFLLAQVPSARSESPAPVALGWSNLASVVTAHPAGSPEQQKALEGLKGVSVRLSLTYALSEKDQGGQPRHRYIHIETIGGDLIFHGRIFGKGKESVAQNGTFTGTIRKLTFTKKGLRETVYDLELDATSFEPLP
jgi:hypothetical protein